MTKRKWPSAFSVLFMAALLGGCGGGQVAGGGTGGTGMVAVRGQVADASTTSTVSGVKTLAGASSAGVSTVVINGITYDISGAEYQGSRPIEPGMVVTLVATNNTVGARTAQSVFYMGELKGPVTGVNAGSSAIAGSFDSMRHTVYWDDRTVTDLGDLSTMMADSCVEVSGFSMGDHRIHATYVAAATGCAEEVEAVGFVTGTNPIVLNTVLTVSPPDGFNEVLTENTDVVKVQGTPNGDAEVLASSIEKLKTMGELDDRYEADEAEVEGLVTGLTTASATTTSTFFVAGQPVQLTRDTKYSGGTYLNVANGMHLEVEGPLKRLNGTGPYYIEAEEVEFKDEIEIVARVSSVAENTLRFFGDVIDVDVTTATQFSGITREEVARDTCVEVRARQVSGRTVATQVQSENECDEEVELRGPIQELAGESFSILGLPIDTSTISEFEYNDRVIEPARFFDLLRDGDFVTVEGDPTSPPSWTKAELED